MSSKSLLSNAIGVGSAPLEDHRVHSPLLDRLFVRWFDRLVYPLIWEDPLADLAALGDISGQNLVCLTSGGCNVLSYLSGNPRQVAAVDLNDSHLALLALKQVAAKKLPYAGFYQLFAQGDVQANAQLLEGLRDELPLFAQRYWDGSRRGWFRDGFYRHGLLGRFIGTGHWLARRLGYDLSAVMRAGSRQEAAEIFEREVAPLFDHALVRFLCAQSWVLYGLGIPPRQYQALKGNAAHMADVLRERLRHLACDYDLADNYFAWQAFARRFDTLHQKALPLYLQQAHYAATRTASDKVSLHHQSVTDYLAAQDAASVNAYVLLDAQDWMSDAQLRALWAEIDRTARKGARVIFRTAGQESPLESVLPPELMARWTTDAMRNHLFWKQDRSAIYGGCFVYVRSHG